MGSFSQQEYAEAVKDLIHHNYLYHVLDKPEISDSDYDQLFHKVLETEKQHPEWVLADSPTQVVGSTSKRYKFVHPIRMYSLENVFNRQELSKFLKRFHSFGKDVANQFYCDYKMDGIALELIYREGKLCAAITRGDGHMGEDVYINAVVIPNIPQHIPTQCLTSIRGEVVVHKSDFYAIVREQEKNNQPIFSNMRNYASGSLRQSDPKVTAARCLKFYAWELIVPDRPKMYRDEQARDLIKLGFNIPNGRVCIDIDDIISFINETARIRNTLPYCIDGVVIKQNDPEISHSVGWNSHAPLWATAWKFAANDGDTYIESIDWRVGYSGVLTPVAILRPVTIEGVTISAVTLDTAQNVETKAIGPKAHIRVIRSGDVIPKITEVISPGEYTGLPTHCPICKEPLTRISKDLFCTNRSCRGRFIAFLTYMTSKNVLNISGIGSKTVENIVNANIVHSLIDLFVPLDASGTNVSQEILDKLVARMRIINLHELLMILGIPDVGRAIASKITSEVQTIQGLKKTLSSKKLFKLLPVNDYTKKNLQLWYDDPYNKELLDKIIALKLPNL